MKILILSVSPLRKDNTIGNTYSNIFGEMENVEFANVFLKSGNPNNKFVHRNFQVTEKRLIKNLVNSKIPTGIELKNSQDIDVLSKRQNLIFNKMRLKRFQIFFWIRDLIWKVGRWKSQEFINFIDDFQPDIIFSPLSDSSYLNDVILYIENYTKKPIVTYTWDDVYTLQQFSLSPLYWINRVLKRKKVKKVAIISKLVYVISSLQKEVFEKKLDIKCNTLWKGYNFSESKSVGYVVNADKPLKLVYVGGIQYGRWKTLSDLAKVVEKINRNKLIMELEIYSPTPKNSKFSKALNIANSSRLLEAVPPEDIIDVIKNADILIHVEALGMKEKLETRLSFSTKLVDYFASERCILAIGDRESASLDYLVKNDAAIVASNVEEVESKLRLLTKNRNLIKEYSKKSWDTGKRNHDISDIQSNLYTDFNKVIKEFENESYTN